MKRIPLSRGQFALVDNKDFRRVNQFKWSLALRKTVCYAQRHIKVDGRWTTQLLHNFILGFKGIDHRDGDGLNNRRKNLRKATALQNRRAKVTKATGCTSRFRGVSRYKSRLNWVAKIKILGQQKTIGYFSSEVEAARAYDAQARQFFGQFASPNFP